MIKTTDGLILLGPSYITACLTPFLKSAKQAVSLVENAEMQCRFEIIIQDEHNYVMKT